MGKHRTECPIIRFIPGKKRKTAGAGITARRHHKHLVLHRSNHELV